MYEWQISYPVERWLRANACDVYAETPLLHSDWIADVVAVSSQKNAIIVVELKTSLNLTVCNQAYRWLGMCNASYIAVPVKKRSQTRVIITPFMQAALEHFGIGLLAVDVEKNLVHVQIKAVVDKDANTDKLRKSLDLNLIGGVSGLPGKANTQYKLTMQRIRAYLEGQSDNDKGGFVTVRDIYMNVRTHWAESSGRRTMSEQLKRHETSWCESGKMGKETVFRIRRE